MTTSAPLTTIVTQGSGANALGPGAKFTINNSVLSPTELAIPVGGAVTWVNADDDTTRTYEFVATDGSFDSGPLGESDEFGVTHKRRSVVGERGCVLIGEEVSCNDEGLQI